MNYAKAKQNCILATSVVWAIFMAVVQCRRDIPDNFIANILPLDIDIAPTKSTQHNDELKEKEEITMALNVTEEIEDSLQNNPSNLNVSEGKIFPSHYTYTDDIIAFYDSRRTTRHMEDVPMIFLIAISGIAIMLTFSIALVSTLYRRRRRLCVASKTSRAKGSFFAVETESHAWDSLSFSNSIGDLSTFKVQFQSLESLSDDSYINSLDEAISLKASIMQKKSLKNASPKSTNATIISHLSINEE